MYEVRLVNNLVAKPCCGDTIFQEIITIFKFTDQLDAWNFWNKESSKYQDKENLGECLLEPIYIGD